MAHKLLQLRRDTAANWTSNDPVLADGELGYENDTGNLKIGDGSSEWTVLAYLSSSTGLDVKVSVDADATAGYIGASSSDGVLRVGDSLSYTDGGDFVTLDTIQGLKTTDSPTFAGLTTAGTVDASAGKVLVEDNGNSVPSGENDGYVGVARVDGTGKLYFVVDGNTYYVDGSIIAVPVTGNPIGLLLALTYA